MLSSSILTEGEMRDGTLCEPFGFQLSMTKGYYLVHRRQTALRPAAAALKQWLLDNLGPAGPLPNL